MNEEMIEKVALAVKAYLFEHTGFGSEYDGDYVVAAYYGGNWVTLDCLKIAEAAVSAYNPNERLPELTDAMVEAGATAFCETQTLDPRKMTKAVYAAMMKAAPGYPNERLREADLLKAVRSFERADTEYRRAKNTGEQPRLNRAGTNYWFRKSSLFKAARSALSPLPQGED